MTTQPDRQNGDWRGVPVLVTGGGGFIGSHLVEELDRNGAVVTVLDNLQAGCWENLSACSTAVKRVEGDIRDGNCVDAALKACGPAYVFHLAANASVPGSVEDPAYDFQSNAGGTFTVLDAIRRLAPGARVVAASSGAVYGEPRDFPITEDSPLQPISPYGASKLCSEVIGHSANNVYGVQVVLARIFNTYGPRMPRFVVLDFLNKLRANADELEILGSGQQVRDFNYVSDTVAGLLGLAMHGVPGEAYNLASGKSHSVTDLAHLLLRVLGLEGRTELRYTGSSWRGDAQRWEVDVAKVRAIGCEHRVTLDVGLQRVTDWYLETTGPCASWPVCAQGEESGEC